MLEEVEYWLSLISQGDYSLLEEELEEYKMTLIPSLSPSEIPEYTLDEVIDIAEGYNE